MDFFAGSGSTGHAVMDRNNGSSFILVQSPDITYEIKNGKEVSLKGCENIYNAGFKRIIDATYQRCKNIIQGYSPLKGSKVKGIGNSLKYYKTAFVGKNNAETANDSDRISLSHKAGALISLSENTLEEIESTNSYQIYTNGKRYTAIYFTEDLSDFPKFVEEVENKNAPTSVFVFTWGSPDIFENEFTDLKSITIKAIPKPILEIYKSLNGGL